MSLEVQECTICHSRDMLVELPGTSKSVQLFQTTVYLVLALNSSLSQMLEELGGTDLPLELTLHLLGLRAVADSNVGSATVRGVSGGERHRVTTAEMIVGTFHHPSYYFVQESVQSKNVRAPRIKLTVESKFLVNARNRKTKLSDSSSSCYLGELLFFAGTYGVLLLDEISTGLDSSATFDIVQALRIFSRIRQNTFLLSLLQPSPEVFDLFDRYPLYTMPEYLFQ